MRRLLRGRRIHPSDPRFRHRRRGGAAHVSIPAVNEPEPVSGNTIYVRLGYQARVRVYARDDSGTNRPSEGGAFASSENGIFRVVSVTSVDDSGPGQNHWEVLLSAVSVGTATLSERVDVETGDPVNASDVPVTDSITVVVYQVATELALYYIEEGSSDELAAYTTLGTPVIRFPVNKNATVRVEGRAGKSVVPLSNVVWDNLGSSKFHFEATADPQIVTLVTDNITADREASVTADGDPSPSAANLSLGFVVGVRDPAGTNLVAFYSVEPR